MDTLFTSSKFLSFCFSVFVSQCHFGSAWWKMLVFLLFKEVDWTTSHLVPWITTETVTSLWIRAIIMVSCKRTKEINTSLVLKHYCESNGTSRRGYIHSLNTSVGGLGGLVLNWVSKYDLILFLPITYFTIVVTV